MLGHGLCMEVGLPLCTGEDAAEKVKSLLRTKGALEGAKRRGHVSDFTGSKEEGWGVDTLQAGNADPSLLPHFLLGPGEPCDNSSLPKESWKVDWT